jgi:hypothetical protein
MARRRVTLRGMMALVAVAAVAVAASLEGRARLKRRWEHFRVAASEHAGLEWYYRYGDERTFETGVDTEERAAHHARMREYYETRW